MPDLQAFPGPAVAGAVNLLGKGLARVIEQDRVNFTPTPRVDGIAARKTDAVIVHEDLQGMPPGSMPSLPNQHISSSAHKQESDSLRKESIARVLQ
jgi:hypothetical protein